MQRHITMNHSVKITIIIILIIAINSVAILARSMKHHALHCCLCYVTATSYKIATCVAYMEDLLDPEFVAAARAMLGAPSSSTALASSVEPQPFVPQQVGDDAAHDFAVAAFGPGVYDIVMRDPHVHQHHHEQRSWQLMEKARSDKTAKRLRTRLEASQVHPNQFQEQSFLIKGRGVGAQLCCTLPGPFIRARLGRDVSAN